jgi:hypothetical protein
MGKPMRIKVDEDLPKISVSILRERGYEASSAVEEGMSGWEDPEL